MIVKGGFQKLLNHGADGELSTRTAVLRESPAFLQKTHERPDPGSVSDSRDIHNSSLLEGRL